MSALSENRGHALHLVDIAPNLSFQLLENVVAERDFAFATKKAALGPHIERKWEWDEDFQRKVHQERFNDKRFLAILKNGSRIGTISFERKLDHARLGEFYILPDFQDRGIGSAVLRHCLELADVEGIPVRLEYLHWNPVASLYQRHGFFEVGRSTIHIFAERSPRRVDEIG